MPTKINYYTLKLIKENLIYIFILLFFIFLAIFLVPSWITKYQNNSDKIKTTVIEVDELKKRKDLLESLKISNLNDIQDFNLVLNNLIPNTEDYFTIIYALEKLSQKSNFIVEDYQVNLNNAFSDRLSLSINGNGDVNSFLTFLNEYNFGGGRLITMNDFDFNNKSAQYNLSLTFYNNQIPKEITQLSPVSQKDIGQMNEIKNKLNFVLKEQPEENTQIDYETTKSLF